MTSFLSIGGGGQGGSVESRALRGIDSRTKSFANKDFVKNIAWLNQSVDTLSAYTQKLQKGVDSANQNAIEQIMGFAADLFVLFGGGEPTGIDIGDLKYVIQGIGALLGINPATPFPLNLFDAAWNMFSNYVVPLEQFTDVIFDAILAWAEDFGLSPELIDSLQDLKDAIEALGTTFSDFFNSIHDLLEVFGTNFPVLGEFWDALVDLLTGIDFSGLKPVIAMLADLGIPFIRALTAIVNAGTAFLNPFSMISAGQIATLSDNVLPPVSNNTTIWTVGIDSTNTWVYDEPTDSFTTLGTGVAKSVVTQRSSPCNPGQKFVVSSKLRWSGIPSAANDFGFQLIWYLGNTEVSRNTVNIASGHGSSSPGTAFVQLANATITVPANVDNFKVAAYNGTGINTGQVWIRDISVRISGSMGMGLVDGLLDSLANLLPFSFFDDLLGIPGANPSQIFTWFTKLLNDLSPLNALNVVGTLLSSVIPGLDASKITSGSVDKLRLPDITRDMSSDLQSAIDAALNGLKGTTGVTGQSPLDWESVFNYLPTKLANVFGGNNFGSASQEKVNEALIKIADTINKQGIAISTLQNMLEGANGFSDSHTFRPTETSTFTTQVLGSYPYTLPSWFVLGTDWLDVVLAGGGGGGDGTGDVVTQGEGVQGSPSRVTVNGVDHYAAAGSGGDYGLWTGQALADLMYLDIIYQGATSGQQPGAGGNAGNASPAGDRQGGKAGSWDYFSVIPTSATINFSVGQGGAGGNAGFFGFAGKKGGDGIVHIRARKAMPSKFTSMGTLILPTYKLNTGVALTDSMTAAASWVRNPPNGASGGHILIIRADSGFQNYVYLRVWYAGGTTNYEVGRVNSGTATVFPGMSGTLLEAIPFNAFSLTSDDAYTFTVAINGAGFASYNDTAHNSLKGNLYRNGGWGSSDSALPGSISQFAFLDTGTPARITSNVIATSQTTSSTSYANLSTVGPSVTLNVPSSGEVRVDFSAFLNHSAAGQTSYVSLVMSGSNTLAANDSNAALMRQMAISAGIAIGTIGRSLHLKNLTPGTTTFSLQYKTTAATATFADRSLIVTPMP
ncbi:minor tail protein [Mycobacterium phage Cuke]|uniref:Minor tail protein n=1 Tax=Mycobacterium phage Cuke TaxID=2079417 RepID=A0A2L1IWS8_9CAUD|nr:minor tail protein [Mycobacterium phage Cuke]AVD99641.1 minor tail protein [Mycobacterium phage Cuke]